jgi:hypothetical protein
MLTLFDNDIPKNNDPVQNVDITTTILYMSTDELREFKKLAKEGIKRLWGSQFQQKGNLTDYILHLMRKDNE